MTDWFSSWFDSSYYHLLYGNRDYSEADNFIQRLFNHIDLKDDSRVLDLACGKGRHSLSICNMGYIVTGVDLSPSSILEANKLVFDNLDFAVHDMRKLYKSNHFDLIVNLFTSFGYFDDPLDNDRVIRNMKLNLKEDGQLILDYLNPSFVKSGLIEKEEKELNGTIFRIRRKIENKIVIKDINFKVDSKEFHFQERVNLFDYADFEAFFAKQSMSIIDVWGDYHLNPLSSTSSRQIFHVK